MYIEYNSGEGYNEFIIKDIHHITFPSLRILNLGQNNLESIETFHRIEIPCLKSLYLCNYGVYKGKNNISTIRDLVKLHQSL